MATPPQRRWSAGHWLVRPANLKPFEPAGAVVGRTRTQLWWGCLVGAAVGRNIASSMRRALAFLGVLAVLAASAGVAYAATVTYTGSTSQSQPFKLVLRPDGVRFRLSWRAGCGDGGKPFSAETASQRALPLHAAHFSSRETYDAKASDGATVHYAIVISGAVRRRGATGTWQAVASGPYKDGGTYRCDTGKVTWRARRGG
jgi:hypothetical protein